MVFGYKCPCCGQEATEREPAGEEFVLPMCMSCDDDPKAEPPDMSVHTITSELTAQHSAHSYAHSEQ